MRTSVTRQTPDCCAHTLGLSVSFNERAVPTQGDSEKPQDFGRNRCATAREELQASTERQTDFAEDKLIVDVERSREARFHSIKLSKGAVECRS